MDSRARVCARSRFFYQRFNEMEQYQRPTYYSIRMFTSLNNNNTFDIHGGKNRHCVEWNETLCMVESTLPQTTTTTAAAASVVFKAYILPGIEWMHASEVVSRRHKKQVVAAGEGVGKMSENYRREQWRRNLERFELCSSCVWSLFVDRTPSAN